MPLHCKLHLGGSMLLHSQTVKEICVDYVEEMFCDTGKTEKKQ